MSLKYVYSCNFIRKVPSWRQSRALPLYCIPFFVENRVTSVFTKGVNTDSQNGLDGLESSLGWTGSFEILVKSLRTILILLSNVYISSPGSELYDFGVDVWSVMCIGIHLISGLLPWTKKYKNVPIFGLFFTVSITPPSLLILVVVPE